MNVVRLSKYYHQYIIYKKIEDMSANLPHADKSFVVTLLLVMSKVNPKSSSQVRNYSLFR